MNKTTDSIIKAYITGIDWSCYYTKGVIAPTTTEINKYYDFTWTQILILNLLDNEKKLSMSQAAKRLALPPQNLTKTIDSLENAGLIIRFHEENNKRLVYIQLTNTGISVAKHCRKILGDFYNKKIEQILTPEQQKEFYDSMKELSDLLAKLN